MFSLLSSVSQSSSEDGTFKQATEASSYTDQPHKAPPPKTYFPISIYCLPIFKT
jgi:hypothetical protein